jgi:hypothetical protein
VRGLIEDNVSTTSKLLACAGLATLRAESLGGSVVFVHDLRVSRLLRPSEQPEPLPSPQKQRR